MAKYMKTEDGYQKIETTVSPIVETKMDANNPVGTGSFSMGRKAGSIVGTDSHAEGYNTIASRESSHAEGQNTTASGYGSHAEGGSTTAQGDYSHAEGNTTSASGNYSHAEGQNTTASGSYSHAEGQKTTASGYGSHAEGTNTFAIGNYSHTEGSGTIASSIGSHAEGLTTSASGNYSHTEGAGTIASGSCSHTEGLYTRAKSSNQHVQGKYNVEDSQDKYAHIVGNGTSESARSNAYTLDWNGNAWFNGRPQFGGTEMGIGSQTVMANGDKEIILASSTEGSTKKFKITVDDSGALTATEVTT